MHFKIVGIGELIWDRLPDADQLGGAPTNFSYHAHSLGAQVQLITRVGSDDLGKKSLERLTQLGLDIRSIQIDPLLPTSTATIDLKPDGTPHFTIHEDVAWDNLEDNTAGRRSCSLADAVCFGTLAQRNPKSHATIKSLLRSASQEALKVLDINLRAPHYNEELVLDSLNFANVLKLNEMELPLLSAWFNLKGNETNQMESLADRFSLKCVAYTRGKRGSILLAGNTLSEHPGLSTQVVDTVGAGDSFTAALTLGLLAKWPLETIHGHATRLASFVCSKAGATPAIPEFLKTPFREIP